jgi:uncharacterized protein YnzC (UPF0291/DUF896 family)
MHRAAIVVAIVIDQNAVELSDQLQPKRDHFRSMAKRKRKLTAAEKRARREHRRKYMTIFVGGKQKQVPRPQLIDGLPVDEFIARNADPSWVHQNEMWEYLAPDEESPRPDNEDTVDCWPAA